MRTRYPASGPCGGGGGEGAARASVGEGQPAPAVETLFQRLGREVYHLKTVEVSRYLGDPEGNTAQGAPSGEGATHAAFRSVLHECTEDHRSRRGQRQRDHDDPDPHLRQQDPFQASHFLDTSVEEPGRHPDREHGGGQREPLKRIRDTGGRSGGDLPLLDVTAGGNGTTAGRPAAGVLTIDLARGSGGDGIPKCSLPGRKRHPPCRSGNSGSPPASRPDGRGPLYSRAVTGRGARPS